MADRVGPPVALEADPQVNKCKRVKRADSPTRCKSTRGKSQCWYESVPGSETCQIHCGRPTVNAEQEKIGQYRLTQYQARMMEFSNNPKVKSLRDEIAIARMTLEAIINKCQTPNELFIHSTKIGEMLTRIEKLIVSCNNLEQKTGMLLDKTQIVNIAEQLVQVITAHVDDPDTLLTVSDEIGRVLLDNIS